MLRFKFNLRNQPNWHPWGLAVTLQEDSFVSEPTSSSGGANSADSTARMQRIAVRSTCSAESDGLVDSIEQLLFLFPVALPQLYCGTSRPKVIVDLLERGEMHLPLDSGADAQAVCDAIAASDSCEIAESNLNLHLISALDRLSQGIVRNVVGLVRGTCLQMAPQREALIGFCSTRCLTIAGMRHCARHLSTPKCQQWVPPLFRQERT